MDKDILLADPASTVDRAYAISMTIKSFKGRRDVQVHLFRTGWDKAEAAGLPLAEALESASADDTSALVLLEAFTRPERDEIVDWIERQYETRVSAVQSAPMALPLPAGLAPLSSIETDKSVGVIDFARIPSYPLTIPLMGLYDLSQHRPLVDA